MTTLSPDTIFIVNKQFEPSHALKAALESRRYCVQLAQYLSQAIQAIHAEPPALVLLDDLDLNPQDCFAFCHEIAAHHLPIVLLAGESAWADDADMLHEVGIHELLYKPIRDSELQTRLRNLLNAKHNQDALILELALRNDELVQAVKNSKSSTLLKDSIVSSVSHEMRTPLLQVKSAVALLAESTRTVSVNRNDPDKLLIFAEEAIKLVDYMTIATTRLEGVVQDITQLAASLNLKSEPFPLPDAIAQATRQLARRWESSNGAARVRVKIKGSPVVIGDRSAIAQVLQQLLDNAIKFSPEGGAVEIKAQFDKLGLWIAVSDKGIGIAPDQLDMIFGAFYQVDTRTTRSFGGVGIGLAIVKLILDAHGAPIDVKSELGSGSIFSFRLPVAQLD